MTHADDQRIRRCAHDLLVKLWHRRDQIWSVSPDVNKLIPVPTDVVVRSLLGVRLEEPEEIPADPQTPNFEIAGFINREEHRIVVAQKYKSEYQRFTMAHEIGHAVLNP